ncbi:recombinase family protein [Amycolatopsis antarctica]|uniref:recombinase family protein n=1 Tax=Amycolatopsis antarctica TaxID=1854586 RepID=UPI00196A36BA
MWDGSVFTVTKFDRFARNMAEANQILTDLRGRGVLFGLAASVYDWDDPFDRLFPQNPRDGRRVRGRPQPPAHPRRRGHRQTQGQVQRETAHTA